MWSRLAHILSIKPHSSKSTEHSRRRQVVLTDTCITALKQCLAPEIRKGHEGIAYLFGLTDGATALAVMVMRPVANTTFGSFSVDISSMARVVRSASNLGLQVVGQVHTHPGEAYHSDGDEIGARIRYTGYTSIVLPNYGRYLPDLTEAAVYMFDSVQGFINLDARNIKITSGQMA